MNIAMNSAYKIAWVWMLAALFSSAAASTLQVDPAQLKEAYPEQYTIREGDTFEQITGVFLKTPWRAEDVWGALPELHVGDKVSLVILGQRTFLQFKHGRNVKLSPQVRIPRDERAQYIISLSDIRQFLIKPQILVDEELVDAPYVVGNSEGRVLMAEGFDIYARNLAYAEPGERYTLVRRGQRYRSGKEDMGIYEAIYLGEARLKKGGVPATLSVLDAEKEILVGDYLLPQEKKQSLRDFIPRTPEYFEGGRIIAVAGGGSQIGRNQIIVIDKGENANLKRGHMLTVFRAGQALRDHINPDGEILMTPREKSGEIMLFRVFETVSYALVMESTAAIHINDQIDLP